MSNLELLKRGVLNQAESREADEAWRRLSKDNEVP